MNARGRGWWLLAAALVAAKGEADEPSASATADALYRQGRALLREGKTALACPLLEESLRLDPQGGAALAAGECHEAAGKLALALARYQDALAAARRRRPDREREITARIDALSPRLAWITLSPASSALAGFSLSLDGVALGVGSFGVPLPLDPGPHSLRASAPGHLPRDLSVTLRQGERLSAPIPALDPVPAAPPASSSAPAPLAPPSAEPPAPPAASSQATSPPVAAPTPARRPLALGLGGGAVLLAAVGGALLVRAHTQAADAQSRCFPTCEAGGGQSLYRQSLTTQNVAIASLIGASALAVGGAVVWFSAPARTSAFMGVSGRF